MQRKFLIIDDHDDLSSGLKAVFDKLGHAVETIEDRVEAVALDKIDDFDVVITDLDNIDAIPEAVQTGEKGETCLPEIEPHQPSEHIRAFKICATGFDRDEFDETELKNFFELILNYKAQFVDRIEIIKDLREKIEFEFPSAISPMHSILDYLTKRVEKIGTGGGDNSHLFIALDEAFVNAVKHGNKFDSQKNVRIAAEISKKEARFTFEDEGEGFDVASIPDPRDPENLFKTSGRGVLLIHNIMDEVRYNERGNRLEMIKKSEVRSPESKVE
ncbi:MAG TPA: ATP-binding protein [Pyrinomonadaceae bacterium]|nr:ATP-binding protein [Pyrinomonadaceae bacterium]